MRERLCFWPRKQGHGWDEVEGKVAARGIESNREMLGA